jgi:Mn2+/Fe2+ NRAMP family transporter
MASPSRDPKRLPSILLGAAFLMATSSIGPGFITQTAVFTGNLAASFGFVILCSIVLDVFVQLNIWRIVSSAGMRAQDLANKFLPGSGYLLSALIVIGGLAFNIGNIAGAGLGLQTMLGVEIQIGAVVSAGLSAFLFWYPDAGKAMDWFTKILGMLMIGLTTYIVWRSSPPVGEALYRTLLPSKIDTAAILTLVGGTVGGYISFAGVHRLLDDGIAGPDHVKTVSKSAVRAILIVSGMRILLFLAAFGVIATGMALSPDNPAGSVFSSVAGATGLRIFGLVLWCAAITSVVGSAYTSISFLRSFHPRVERHQRIFVTAFIFISMAVFIAVGRPVSLLVIVGALNAFVLPFALVILLLISRKMMKQGTLRQPLWLVIGGWIAAAALSVLCIKTLLYDLTSLWH